MLNLKNTWMGLDRRQQVLAILAGVLVFIGVLAMSRLATQPSFRLLYSDLEASTSGEVVRALEQRGVAFQVRGSAIYVDAALRDELRMTLASEGLPANGGRGYELLDSLSGFGTTSQMFDAAYWRAKEGELARTIISAPYISAARVHIANTAGNPFQRSVEPSASISVTPSGGAVSVTQAEALRHLVASAVSGLSVDNVTVVDATGQLIGSEESASGATTALSRGDMLREKVLRLVEARVGQGNAFVEVSVDTVTESQIIRERLVDPASRVAISTDTEERSNNSTSTADAVSVNSNLPDGDAARGDDSQAQTSEIRERVNYEVSETEREIQRSPGEIRRLTVAVLVNGAPSTDPTAGFVPRSEEELSALEELVASAVGFNANRGDVITIKSMGLPSVTPVGTEGSQRLFELGALDVLSFVKLFVVAIVTLLLGLFVVRPILMRNAQVAQAALTQSPMSPAMSTPIEGGTEQPEPPQADLPAPAEATALGAPTQTKPAVERLRELIGDRQEETVEILRGWLEEREENV